MSEEDGKRPGKSERLSQPRDERSNGERAPTWLVRE
jgi:hypothetical protein